MLQTLLLPVSTLTLVGNTLIYAYTTTPHMNKALKHNRTRDQIAQANTHTHRHMNNVWSEMVISNPCLSLYCIFPRWFKQCI